MGSDDLIDEIEKFSLHNPIVTIKKNYTSNSNLELSWAEQVPYIDSELENIRKQTSEVFRKESDIDIANYILSNMNKFGFLKISTTEISKSIKKSEEQIKKIIEIIQKDFEPRNLLAYNSKEFILMSIISIYGESSLTLKVFEMLSKTNSITRTKKYFEKTLGINIKEHINNIKKIGLSPLNENSDSINYIYPDVIIDYDENTKKLSPKFNKKVYPRVSINKKYVDTIESNGNKDDISASKNLIRKASQFIYFLECRKNTIVSLSEKLCKIQELFLSGKTKYPAPLTMKQMSKSLNVHPSSITRCVNNKYIDSPIGIIPLKSLFSTSFYTDYGNQVCTKEIDANIEYIIKNESSSSPLSDIDIKNELDNLGIHCSRRCVTKRRNILKIPNSRNRHGI